MKIGILGYGKMGRLIAAVAQDRNHSVVTCDPAASDAMEGSLEGLVAREPDVCIEFSTPAAVMGNIEGVLSAGVPLVVGTTGWYDRIEEVQAAVKKSGTGFVYAANFSPGVNMFFRIVQEAAKLVNQVSNYDISGVELHHNQKKDSPSGTAEHLAGIVLRHVERKEQALYEVVNRTVEPQEFQLTSVRCGNIPGVHEIVIDSEADTISLKHTARNRSGFALGAVLAAEWLEKKIGFFTVDDIMADLLAA